MKEKIRSCFVLLWLLIFVAGCSLPFGQSSKNLTPTSVSTPLPLTMELLNNAEYQALNGSKLVRLVDGKYETGSGTDYLIVSILDEVAFGDLNSDGAQDAAIILVENYGGTGDIVYLVPIFNIDGAPSPSSGYLLGDRVIVNSMKIADNRITLDMVVHTPNDPLCCPSLPMTQSFKFYWGAGLVQVSASSGAATDGMREIKIETPVEGDVVTSHIQLAGNVSIAPFENTLVVRIMDSNNTPVYQGQIMVSAPDLGAPGSFAVDVDLSGSPVNPGMLRIEILDISMADGSILAMDSVDVILK